VEKMEKGIIPATITPLNPVINLLTSNDMEDVENNQNA
jgi:hypothetical protein